MSILLSIKPTYVEAIMRGNKQFEFRKSIFRDKDVRSAYIYSTAPVKKVVGMFRIGRIIEDNPAQLWEQLKEQSGLEEQEFFRYFGNKEKGYAIEIDAVQWFREPVDPGNLIPRFVPPQSFRYVDGVFVKLMELP